MAAFEPSNTLKSRTFIGLITAQFLAAFNDQTIHASAMFYAIRPGREILSKDQAISLMPILFFAPWAIFCTLAGYLADRYSKRNSLIFWKIAEIGITMVALAGFCVGTGLKSAAGAWMVLSTVFLMGTHSAFFVPAKYGAMPEILQPNLLSKGNGILESTSFLAVILGTVCGGILSYEFRGHEYFIGLVLVTLALLGAGASFLIQPMPAANPDRPFPLNPFTPLLANLRVMLRSRPLALSVLGIAFFTFMVAFMRATMYMHGEAQNPHWNEFHTSMVVATVALGVGLGSPLAGFLSGGKVELGLVPLGAVGMIVASVVAAFALFQEPLLIACLILIGFFSGFYIVPLYTLLQHRAPKTSKGDFIATSNFINVTGAIVASFLFFSLVEAAKVVGVARSVPQEDVAQGQLVTLLNYPKGRPLLITVRVRDPNSQETRLVSKRRFIKSKARDKYLEELFPELARVPYPHHAVTLAVGEDVREGAEVVISKWKESPHGVEHDELRLAGGPPPDAYDQEDVPRFLFIGAGVMTLAILLILCRLLPDFFVRSLLWIRSHGRHRITVVGQNSLPSNGAAILATNCDRFEMCMNVIAATDRFTRFVLFESAADPAPRPLLRYLARRTGLVALHPEALTQQERTRALARAVTSLEEGHLVALTTADGDHASETAMFLDELRTRKAAPVLPVYCGAALALRKDSTPSLSSGPARVVIGPPLPPDATVEEIRQAIHALGDWSERSAGAEDGVPSAMIPGAANAWQTTPAECPPASP